MHFRPLRARAPVRRFDMPKMGQGRLHDEAFA